MEFVTEKLDLKINETEYKLSYLDFDSVEKILESLDGEGKDDLKVVLKLKGDVLVDAGMPRDILGKLQMKHVNEIFEAVIGTKKD